METINQIKDDILNIVYQGKKISINITEELAINESTINNQLKNLPSNYAFLCLLRDKAIKKANKLEKEKDEAFSKAWIFYKESDPKINNDMASHKAVTNSKYQSLEKKYLIAQDKATRLSSICRAYESRERIIQTISANLRKQQ